MGDAIAQAQALLHGVAAQVDIAVFQPQVFVHILVIELERRRVGAVENFQLVRQHLDFAGGQLRVDGGLVAQPHLAFHPQHKLVAHLLGQRKHVGAIRVEHNLHQPFAVAQVDKNHAAVVAPAVRPAAQGHLLSVQCFGDLSAIMTAHDV